MATEDPSELTNLVPVIQDIRGMCTPQDDINLVKKVGVLMQEAFVRRREEDEQMRADLKPLGNKLASARQSAQRPANVPSQSAHAQTINKLDSKRFALVKAIEEGESALNDKEAEYNRLKAELKELEERNVTDTVELDGTAVRLNLYRELGFHWTEDKASADGPKVLIRTQSEDMHMVPLDGSLTSFELCNRLWELSSK